MLGYLPRLAAAAALAVLAGCATLQAPRHHPTPRAVESDIAVTRDGVTLRTQPIQDAARYEELFGDDLPAIGIVAVWVDLRSAQEVDLSRIRWRLESAAVAWKTLDLEGLFDAYYDRRHIRMYQMAADQAARRDLGRFLFRAGSPPGGGGKGLVFFRADHGGARGAFEAARLRVERIRLAGGREVALEIPLCHGCP